MKMDNKFKKYSFKMACLILLLLGQGCELYIPKTTSKGYTHLETSHVVTVQKGDTLYSLAKKNNVPIRDFIISNQLKSPYIIHVGQKLRIPKAPVHTVQKGETLYSISRRYNVSLNSLAKINDISSPTSLQTGQKLFLPAVAYSGASADFSNKTTTQWSSASKLASASTSSAGAKVASSKNKKAVQKAPLKNQKNDKKATLSSNQKKVSLPKPAPLSKGKFSWPVKGKIISSYGPHGKGKFNDGINIAAQKGQTVVAAQNGVVAYAGNGLKGFGNLLLIKHDKGWVTAYAHNEKLLVSKGQKVTKGQAVAQTGSTGNVNTPQLHFEIRRGVKSLDPKKYLE